MLSRRLMRVVAQPAFSFSTDKTGAHAAEAFPIKYAFQSDMFKAKDMFFKMEYEMRESRAFAEMMLKDLVPKPVDETQPDDVMNAISTFDRRKLKMKKHKRKKRKKKIRSVTRAIRKI